MMGKTYYDSDLPFEDENSTADIKKEDKLTKRQNQILELIGESLSNKQIAEKLIISEHTVTTHRKNMIVKLGLEGRDALLKYVLNRGYDFD